MSFHLLFRAGLRCVVCALSMTLGVAGCGGAGTTPDLSMPDLSAPGGDAAGAMDASVGATDSALAAIDASGSPVDATVGTVDALAAGSDSGAGNANPPLSCAPGGPGMTNCGAGGSGTESCCTSPSVTGATFYRTYTNSGAGPTGEADPANVSDFRLDKYLVTVGRFRQFVKAWKGGYTPAPASGKHTHLNAGNGLAAVGGAGLTWEAGWSASDNGNIAPTDANLTTGCDDVTFATWTAAAGSQESLPINCVNWQEAYAFCIWDGGFLPSEAEFELAAAGGAQQREYPWGTAAPGTANQYSIYGCYYPGGSGTCSSVSSYAPVGSATLGAGLFGQMDLDGEVFEWNLDWYASPYVDPCTDCANLATGMYRSQRGGRFDRSTYLLPPFRGPGVPASRSYVTGFRCARAPRTCGKYPCSCADGIKNGDETAVDCGGSCAPCGSGAACSVNPDCTSASCTLSTPTNTLSISPVAGAFYPNMSDTCSFPVQATDTPSWSQTFPAINFNPPTGTVPGDTSGTGIGTHPFTDVLTDSSGNYSGTQIAAGNGLQAGVGTYLNFAAIFTGTINVGSAGTYTLNFYSDDGFIFGVGGGATAAIGNPNINPPTSGKTVLKSLAVMASYNQPSSATANPVRVVFPAAGVYPFEADYTECVGGGLSFTMGAASGVIVPQHGTCK